MIVLARDQGLAPEYPDSQGVFAIVTDEAWVYWLDAWSHLARVPKGGGQVQDLADTEGAPHQLVLVGDYLYFTSVPRRRIERIHKGGSAIEAVTPASTGPWRDVQDFAIDGPRVTWIDALRLLRCEAMPCSVEADRDIVAGEMARHDVNADAVVIAGKVHRRVLRQSQTCMTSAGEVVVERTLYKDRKDADGRCVSPIELALGIVGDFWTPRAAQQALWVVTQMTPRKSAELF